MTDTSCTTLSQEGRIYQLEYAEKCIQNQPTVLGIVFKNGVVLLSEKVRQSKAMLPGTNPSIYSVAPNIGIAICGLLPDGRNLVSRARLEASNYLKTYGIDITGKILCERLSLYVHAHTCHWGVRPFGCSVFISSYDRDNVYHLYMLETSGNYFEYYTTAAGKGRQSVKADVEKDNFAIRNQTVKEGLLSALKILSKSYEGEKETEYDISEISDETKGKHVIYNKERTQALSQEAKSDGSNKMQVDS